MTIHGNFVIEPGQLWEVRDRALFVVDTTSGEDACYPIVMREVARTAAAQRILDGIVRSYAPCEPAATNAARAARINSTTVMNQERKWFALAKVSYWASGVPEWCEQNDGSLVAA